MNITHKSLFLLPTLILASTLFACGATFDVVPYDGQYSLVSVERENEVPDTDIDLDFPPEAKLNITVVTEDPKTLYGESFFAFTSKTETSWYCWFFIDCSLEDYSLQDAHVGSNEIVFWLHQNLVSNQAQIDPVHFAFSWIDETEGTIRIAVSFQSYLAVFQG